ncbi:D-alanine--D-alanine ligase family protein [Tessaracoccus flavus]|uniref:D-alanine--D-alanine ligase n=1 Tax=Tessaracoccus flavus TaxID=1610493 RepID=A0A1Q2CEY6_9ACTN|nr:D-alanine--D-alanine ligase family protein [Tessaracoccus flavus]AQP44615.1 D-alanine--D-alanine ligase A [Tessaracoccus flavus]SDZ08349.1 D-alanine-D-alanine ligase [Tessaracoccus flavus]
MSDRTRVALIFGGQSSEHGISCLTAASVLKAIDRDRFDVVGVGISKTGRWTQVPLDVVAAYAIVDGVPPEVDEPVHDAVWMVGEHGCEVASRSGETLVDINAVDVAFALLHGPYGEDGTIQGMFEMMGIRYVGSGVTASAVGMDKHFMKVAFEAAGLPVGPYVAASAHRLTHDREAVLAEVEALEYPLFVKPARGGSSIGIVRVTEPGQLDAAIEEAQRFDPKIVIEQGFTGARELEVAVLGNPDAPDGCDASVLGEIRVNAKDGFYDYEAKYFDEDGAALDAPADVTPELAARIQELAKQAFHAVDAEGLVRADFFVADDDVWINEVNTMPGFTRISMYPTLWQASGLTYTDLVARLIELALQRPVGLR